MKFFDYSAAIDCVRQYLLQKVFRLEDQRIKEYIEHRGVRCLHCGSDEINTVYPYPRPLDEGNPDSWLLQVVCDDCKESWTDILLLVNVQDANFYEEMEK